VLVTSRNLLHISGEHEYPLPPLEVPRPDADRAAVLRSEAVDLLVRRATASQPSFRVDSENASQVGELCRRLDGLPLAIELAAARLKLLSLPAILQRLDHRLLLLAGGPRDAPVRHHSVRAAVAWSYDLLGPSARRLIQQLSVFRGGWTLHAAAAVNGEEGATPDEVLDTLASLLDASLLVRIAPDSAEPRLTMLETIREFAAERLEEAGDSDLVRGRHAGYYLDLLEGVSPGFIGSDPATALDAAAAEHDNVRSALDYLLRTKPEDALRLASAIWRFWQMRGHLLEGSRWLAEMVMRPPAGSRTGGVTSRRPSCSTRRPSPFGGASPRRSGSRMRSTISRSWLGRSTALHRKIPNEPRTPRVSLRKPSGSIWIPAMRR
jgi:predicted ATPase